MQPMARRFFGQLIATGAGIFTLTRCTTANSGGKTTYTLDTAKIDQDGSAILSALAAILASPSMMALLGPNLVVAEAAAAAAKAALGSFDSLTGGSESVTVDETQLTQLISSMITNTQTVLSLVQAVLPKLGGSLATSMGNYVSAVLTLIPLVQLAAGMVGASAAKPLMSEEQALDIAIH